jgi:hypothetical protein
LEPNILPRAFPAKTLSDFASVRVLGQVESGTGLTEIVASLS